MTMSRKNYQHAVDMLNREMERTVADYGSPLSSSKISITPKDRDDNQWASHAARHTLFNLAAQMADNFQQDNPRFNRERFFSALNEDFA
jgi:hypothetical protein|tara:strand:- start:723 stop:989 length:267 start_codon:yes stop_codon:yes gene_type:complete